MVRKEWNGGKLRVIMEYFGVVEKIEQWVGELS